MSVHAPATPDVEAVVYGLLKSLGGITVWAVDAQTPWPNVSDSVTVQVDVRASNKKRARDRAYSARQLLLRLPFDSAPQGVVRSEIQSGPIWLPDDDGAPRYVITSVVTVRATRG